MPFQRKFTPEARDLLRKLPPAVKPRIRALTDRLLENPHAGKALQGELDGYYSVRHGHYRIIYSINVKKKWIIIEYVGIRENVYELFSRLAGLGGRR